MTTIFAEFEEHDPYPDGEIVPDINDYLRMEAESREEHEDTDGCCECGGDHTCQDCSTFRSHDGPDDGGQYIAPHLSSFQALWLRVKMHLEYWNALARKALGFGTFWE